MSSPRWTREFCSLSISGSSREIKRNCRSAADYRRGYKAVPESFICVADEAVHCWLDSPEVGMLNSSVVDGVSESPRCSQITRRGWMVSNPYEGQSPTIQAPD